MFELDEVKIMFPDTTFEKEVFYFLPAIRVVNTVDDSTMGLFPFVEGDKLSYRAASVRANMLKAALYQAYQARG